MSDFAISRESSITEKTAITGKSADQMGMEDFFKLLVAQMTNQDMNDPQSSTEYIAQMAQFASLQGMNAIQENQTASYAVSYSGKEVTIAHVNESTGNLDTVKGIVEKVTFYDGKPQVVVNGTKYPIHEIMEVNTDITSQKEQSAGNSLNLVSGYIGKTVTVTDTSDPDNPQNVTGTVTSVTLKGGKPYVIVNGNEYAYTAITSVGEEETEIDGDFLEESGERAKYVNKTVDISQVDEDGNETVINGVVTDYYYYNSKWHVAVDGKDYPVDDIKKVYAN